MADSDLQISFGGDASSLKAAAAEAEQSLDDLAPAVEAASRCFELLQKAVESAFRKPSADGIKAAAASAASSAQASGAGGHSRVAAWEQSFRAAEAASGDFYADETSRSLAFWQNILSTENLSAQERLQIDQKVYAEKKALAAEARNSALADLQAQVKIELDQQNAQTAAVQAGLQARMQAVRAAAQQGEISPSAELADLLALNDAEIANERAKADAVYQINLDAEQKKAALYGVGSLAARKAADDELILAQQHDDALTQIVTRGALERQRIEQQALQQQRQAWDSTINPLVQSWSQGMLQMAEGSKSFSQVMRSLGESILSDFVTKVIDPLVERWLWHEAEKTGISSAESALRKAIQSLESLFGVTAAKTEAIAAVGSNAAAAGAAATASAAAIPLIGWSIAPAAGAAAASAALGFSSLIVAEGGLGVVPFDNMPALLHRNETVLPASIANPLRGMLARFNPAQAGGGGLGGGDVHHHHTSLNISAVDAKGVQGFFDQHGDKLFKTINGKLRSGARLATSP